MISREEAIKEVVHEVCEGCEYIECCKKNTCGYYKAISDMQKLEKIEEIVDIVNKSNDRTDAILIHQNNMMYGFDDIRRIVKEV